MSKIGRISPVLITMGLLAGGVMVSAQEDLDVAPLLRECQRNIKSSPRDGQRACREVIAQVQMAFFPELYDDEKREAFFLLAESYFQTGRIQDSIAHFDSVEAVGSYDDFTSQQVGLRQEEIARLFRPLRIAIRDRRVPLLSYIEGMDIDFDYPRRLEPTQINRLKILKDKTLRREDELQFVGFDDDGQAYMEIDSFPVITFGGRSFGYSLIVEGQRRYRFNFSGTDTSAVEIFWEEEAGWKLIERVPEEMVKIELPEKYSFDIDTQGTAKVVTRGNAQHVYLPAVAETQLTLKASREGTWERVYDITLYAIIVLTGGSALVGAR